MKKLSLFLLCASLSSSITANDLLHYYHLAKQQDATLKSARATYLATVQNKPIALSALLPTVSASVTSTGIQSSTRTLGRYNSNNNTISLSQTLLDVASLTGYIKARSEATAAGHTYMAAELDLMLRLTEQYFSILKAQDSMRSAAAKRKAFARHLEQTQQRFDVGLIAITDVHEAKARHDSATAQEIQAKNTLANEKERLREIVGLHIEDIAPLQQSILLNDPEPNAIEFWVEKARYSNFTVQAAKETMRTAKLNKIKEYSGHLPTVSLSGSTSNASPVPPSTLDVRTKSIGVTLSIPILSGGSVLARGKQAHHNYVNNRSAHTLALREAESATRQAFRGIHTQISEVKALKQAVVSSRSALEATEAAYQAGTRTIVDVLNVQSDLLDADRNYHASRYDYLLEHLKLKQAAGNLSIEDLQLINQQLQTKS